MQRIMSVKKTERHRNWNKQTGTETDGQVDRNRIRNTQIQMETVTYRQRHT